MTLCCAISKSKLEPLYGRDAGTVALATGMFAFERMSSFAAPAVRASRNGTIHSSVRSAELEETRLCLNQSSPYGLRPLLRPLGPSGRWDAEVDRRPKGAMGPAAVYQTYCPVGHSRPLDGARNA